MTELNLIDKGELRSDISSYRANICKNFLWKLWNFTNLNIYIVNNNNNVIILVIIIILILYLIYYYILVYKILIYIDIYI